MLDIHYFCKLWIFAVFSYYYAVAESLNRIKEILRNGRQSLLMEMPN